MAKNQSRSATVTNTSGNGSVPQRAAGTDVFINGVWYKNQPPAVSVSPSVTPSITPSITPTKSITPTPSVTPSITPSLTPTPSRP